MEIEEEEGQQNSVSEEAINVWAFKMLSSLSSIYAAIYFIKTDDDSFDEVKGYKDFSLFNVETNPGGKAALEKFAEGVVLDKYRGFIKAFCDFSDIEDRLGSEDSISAEFINVSNEWCRCRIIVTDRARNGKVQALLFVVRNINEEKLHIHDLENALNQASNMAYRDALTGVKNKACFDEYQQQLDSAIEFGTADFAVAFFDVNGLKFVNDHYGHNKGDQLLIDASICICKAFKDCPVFRLGGDEFAVLIYKISDKNKSRYILSLEAEMDEINKNYGSDYRVSIAWGFMAYEEGKFKSCSEVYKAADDAMYKHKKLIKSIPGNDWMIRD